MYHAAYFIFRFICLADLERKSDQLRSATAKLRTLKAEIQQKDLALENMQNQLSSVAQEHSKSVLKTQVHVSQSFICDIYNVR